MEKKLLNEINNYLQLMGLTPLYEIQKYNNILLESSNGKIPDSELAYVNTPDGGKSVAKLNLNAAKDFNKMVEDAKKDGVNIKLSGANSGYRKLGSDEGDWKTTCNNQGFTQWCAWKKYKAKVGNEAAYPGTSNHGFGSAIDVANCSRGSKVHNWLSKNSKKYGFEPYKNESWHWDHTGSITNSSNIDNSVKEPTNVTKPPIVTNTETSETKPLYYYMKEAQKLLNMPEAEQDGKFGKNSLQALKDFITQNS